MRYLVGVLAVLLGAVLRAQNPSTDFETVSVKPHDPEIAFTASGIRGSEWIVTKMSLFQLVHVAYPEFDEPGRLVGGEPWTRETSFDIRAKGVERLSFPVVQTMIRRFLADRFRLRTHKEARPIDVFIARLVRSDGKLGPWLVPTAPDCVEAREKRVPLPTSCESLERARAADRGGPALTVSGVPVAEVFRLFRQLGGFDRPIVDRTGLSGRYDLSVRFDSANPLEVPTGGISFLTAVREQLGIRFDATRDMVEVLVIDDANLPSFD